MVRMVKTFLPEIYGKREKVHWNPSADAVHYRGPKGEAIILSVYAEGTFTPTLYFFPMRSDGYYEDFSSQEIEYPGKSNLVAAIRPAQRKAKKLCGLPPYR